MSSYPLPVKEKPVDVYIGSLVVHPDYQGKFISLVLLRGLYQSFLELESEGFLFRRMGGTGVTSAGVYTLKTFEKFEVSHEVFGGIALLGEVKNTMQCREEYVGFV